jgi:phosphoenolpyruvate carboxylase
LGVGEAVKEVLDSEDSEILRTMYQEWGSFRTTLELVEMVLAKSEPKIAQHYEEMLVKDPMAQELGHHIRKIHKMTEDAVLDLASHKKFCENNELLTRALQVRNPYVDCMNVMQAEILKRLRESDNAEEEKVLKDALLISITGLANGMGNTG